MLRIEALAVVAHKDLHRDASRGGIFRTFCSITDLRTFDLRIDRNGRRPMPCRIAHRLRSCRHHADKRGRHRAIPHHDHVDGDFQSVFHTSGGDLDSAR